MHALLTRRATPARIFLSLKSSHALASLIEPASLPALHRPPKLNHSDSDPNVGSGALDIML